MVRSGDAGYSGASMLLAHLGAHLESLLFAPAFLAVGWALVATRRGTSPHKESKS